DLLLDGPRLSHLAYSGIKLPDTLALQPFQVADDRGSNLSRAPQVNPNLGQPVYRIAVCNAATTGRVHTLTSLRVRISSLTPYRAPLNVWPRCRGPASSRAGPEAGGWGGAEGADELMRAPSPTGAMAGVNVTAVDTGPDAVTTSPLTGLEPATLSPLPVALAPGDAWDVSIVLDLPGASGTYTLALGVSLDGTALPYLAAGPAILLAPVAHTWTGANCTTQAMQRLIPSDSTAFYLCPDTI